MFSEQRPFAYKDHSFFGPKSGHSTEDFLKTDIFMWSKFYLFLNLIRYFCIIIVVVHRIQGTIKKEMFEIEFCFLLVFRLQRTRTTMLLTDHGSWHFNLKWDIKFSFPTKYPFLTTVEWRQVSPTPLFLFKPFPL